MCICACTVLFYIANYGFIDKMNWFILWLIRLFRNAAVRSNRQLQLLMLDVKIGWRAGVIYGINMEMLFRHLNWDHNALMVLPAKCIPVNVRVFSLLHKNMFSNSKIDFNGWNRNAAVSLVYVNRYHWCLSALMSVCTKVVPIIHLCFIGYSACVQPHNSLPKWQVRLGNVPKRSEKEESER